MSHAIRIQSLTKTFSHTTALDDVSIDIDEGEIVALIGPSGSGKSTLLRHIAGLEVSDRNPDSAVIINGQNLQSQGRLNRKIRYIRSGIGVIFQQFNLIDRLNVLTNVLIGALGSVPRWRGTLGLFTSDEKQRALESLDRVGLKELAWQRASTLSGGQQQRVAIARTQMQRASIVLADEPIASLDPKSAKSVMRDLRDLQKIDGKTVIITLHQVEYARKYCKRAVALVEGKIAFDGKAKHLTDEVLESLYGTSMTDDDELLETESDRPREFTDIRYAAGLSG
jgi:phosphonate transport system ATP-binding protein